MPVDERYRRQVELLVRILPHVAQERCFALKGGTAINLFVRNLPRLSVDIDLTYLPVADRARSLADIEAALRRIGERIEGALPVARVQTGVLREEGTVNKLFVRERGTQIKVEVTPVLRGCVFEPKEKAVSDAVEAQFGFAAIQVASFPDLFAGKVVAALDRQHPRDLFDVHDLLSNEGIDDMKPSGMRPAAAGPSDRRHRRGDCGIPDAAAEDRGGRGGAGRTGRNLARHDRRAGLGRALSAPSSGPQAVAQSTRSRTAVSGFGNHPLSRY